MNIKKGKTYRCESCLDLDIHVLDVVDFGKDFLEIKVCFPYRRNNWIIMDDDFSYKVPLETLKKWKEL